MDRDILLKNIVQILHENWADSTDKETAYLILDKVDEYMDKKAKQGEAYQQMWGWLDNTISAYYGDPKYFREYSTKQIIKIMSELEQKYLKEAKPTETGKAKDNRE